MSSLLDPEFLKRLEALRRRLASEARSGSRGGAVASRRGSSTEFREHRPYEPGDDPRRIDWSASARSGTPMLKLFQADEDRILRLLLDGSASLGFGTPPKLTTAKRLAAALAYVALANSERAQVFLGRDTESGSALGASGVQRRGRPGFAALCRELDPLLAEGQTDLARAVEAVLTRAARPGLLVVFSDFFDQSPWQAALGRAKAQGHDVLLVQILDQEELSPTLEGDFSLEDAETGAELSVSVDASTLESYQGRVRVLFESLRSFAKRHGASYVRLAAHDELEPAIRRLLAHSVD